MNEAERAPDPLRRVLRELADEDAPELIERARRRARDRAEQLIEDAMVEELLQAAGRARQVTRSAAAKPAPARPAPAPSASAPPTPSRGSPEAPLWWAYCILRADAAAVVASELQGIEPGSVVEVVGEDELAALVSAVPAEEYGDEQLRRHLEDLDWVEQTARRHEAVLESVLRETTIVPLRLCTLYRSHEGVRRLLHEHADGLVESLERIEGCAEWGVKVFGEGRPQADEPEPELEGESTGAGYLRRRQRERTVAEQAGEVRVKCVEDVHRRVAELAREATTNPPQRPELHGRPMPMLLNGVYLVEHERMDDLRAAIQDLQEEWHPLGFVIELTGPWPAYNFVAGAAGVMS